MAKLVSQTYGEALYELAEEEGTLGQVSSELKALCGILEDYPQYRELLLHPRLDEEQKWELFRRVFEGRIGGGLSAFCKVLLEKGRFGELDGILAYFEEKRLAHDRIGVAWVTSPAALSGAQKEKIEKKLLETTDFVSLQMHYATEPELIGGVRIQIGDRVVDSSIQSKLGALKSQLMDIQLPCGTGMAEKASSVVLGKETGE